MSQNNDYKPGNPEYDYWNDKHLYLSLEHEKDLPPEKTASTNDAEIGFGAVFGVIFIWLMVFAPFALFFTWEDWIVQIIFWSGVILSLLTFVVAMHNAAKAERQEKQK